MLGSISNERLQEALNAGSDLARTLLDDLAARTADPPGVTRIAYGAGERDACDMMAKAAGAWHADIAFDFAGNQIISVPGLDRSRMICIGSHLDSVPHGGNFDGAAGVVLGLAAQAVMAHLDRQPNYDLVVFCLRAEESCWFPHSYIGSKTALGRLDPSVIDTVRRSDSGRTLADHMREEGFDPDAVREGRRVIDPTRIAAYLEPHIEQGPILVADNAPLGLVTDIRGSFRFSDARCFGTYAHSGATPRALRRDAMVATAELIMGMQSEWERLERAGHDLVVTFGEVGTDPARHGFSIVPGETRLCIDVRSRDQATLDRARTGLVALSHDIAARRQVRFELGPLTTSAPTAMSRPLLKRLEIAAKACGIDPRIMQSGAGHDAATFAQAGVPSGMIFIRNENGSHNPDEDMDWGGLQPGTRPRDGADGSTGRTLAARRSGHG